jgi:hypothetical protein
MCENPAVMAAPAPRRAEADEPPIDPEAVPRAFARERAKRRARDEHELELKRARVRFWALFFGLLFFAIVLSLTILDQIQALFGV